MLHIDQDISLTPIEKALREMHYHYCGDIKNIDCVLNLAEEIPDSEDRNWVIQMVLNDGLNSALPKIQKLFEDDDISIHRYLRYTPPLMYSHDFFELVYLVSGHCINFLADSAFHMTPGDLFMIPPGVSHAIQVFDDYSDIRIILIRRSAFESVFSGILGGNDRISQFFWKALYEKNYDKVMSVKTKDLYSDLISTMYSEKKRKSSQRRQILNSYFQLLMAFISRDCANQIAFVYEGKGNANIIIDIIRYIKETCAHTDLPIAAAYFNYSKAHLTRLIQKYTGQGFADLLKRIRMQKASELLLCSTPIPVEKVMEAVGYTSKSHFYENFKEAYGMTPDRYRTLLKTRPSMEPVKFESIVLTAG